MTGKKATPDPVEQAADRKAKAETLPVPKPPVGVYIYLADDEPDVVNYDGDKVDIRPGSTEIKPRGAHSAKAIADHIVSTLGVWGACVTTGPVTDGKASRPEDQPAVDAATRQYLVRTLAWAQEVVREAYELDKPYLAAGLVRRQTDETQQAKAWLVSREKQLRKEGLLG